MAVEDFDLMMDRALKQIGMPCLQPLERRRLEAAVSSFTNIGQWQVPENPAVYTHEFLSHPYFPNHKRSSVKFRTLLKIWKREHPSDDLDSSQSAASIRDLRLRGYKIEDRGRQRTRRICVGFDDVVMKHLHHKGRAKSSSTRFGGEVI